MVVLASGGDMEREAALQCEPFERMRQQRRRQTTDTVAGEGQLDLRVRPSHEVDGRGRARLIHRHRRRPVARDAVPRAERLRERVAERGKHVLDGVVLVDVEVPGREQVEIEAGVESAEREEVVEEADAGGDADPSLAVVVVLQPE